MQNSRKREARGGGPTKLSPGRGAHTAATRSSSGSEAVQNPINIVFRQHAFCMNTSMLTRASEADAATRPFPRSRKVRTILTFQHLP